MTKRLLVVASILLLLLGVEAGGFQISLLNMSRELGIGGAQTGVMVSAQYGAIIIMPIIFGRISDWAGKKKILVLFSLLFSVGCVGILLSNAYSCILVSVFIIGSGYSVCESTISALLTDEYDEKSGKYLNIAQCFFSLGAVCSPQILVLGRRLWGWGWQSLFLMCGIGFLVVCFLVKVYYVEGKRSNLVPDMVSSQVKEKIKLSKGIYFLAGAMVIYGGIEVGAGYYLDTFVQTELHMPEMSAIILSCFWAAMIPARFLSGLLYRRRNVLLPICFVVSGVILAGIALTSKVWVAFALFALLGFGIGPIWAGIMSAATQRSQGRSGFAAGVISVGCGLGAVIFPVFLGMSVDGFGLRIGFLIMGGLCVIGGVLCRMGDWGRWGRGIL